MSTCCVPTHPGDVPTCPMNGQVAKPVGRKTVESLVTHEARAALTPSLIISVMPLTAIPPMSPQIGDHLITKDLLTVRVGVKETEDPIPLCYCFGYDRKAVRDDIRRDGATDIQKVITQRVKAGECRCEETNPSGGCCLGSVAKAIKHARALKEQGRL